MAVSTPQAGPGGGSLDSVSLCPGLGTKGRVAASALQLQTRFCSAPLLGAAPPPTGDGPPSPHGSARPRPWGSTKPPCHVPTPASHLQLWSRRVLSLPEGLFAFRATSLARQLSKGIVDKCRTGCAASERVLFPRRGSQASILACTHPVWHQRTTALVNGSSQHTPRPKFTGCAIKGPGGDSSKVASEMLRRQLAAQ